MINYEYRGGRVAGQPELKATQNGTPYLRFRLANDDNAFNQETQKWEKKSEHFITVLVWPVRRRGEKIDLPTMLADNLNSGNSVQLFGKFATRSWEADDGSRRSVEEFVAQSVAVDTMEILPWIKMEDGGGTTAGTTQQGAPAQQQQGGSWGGGQNLQQAPQDNQQQGQASQQGAQSHQGNVWGDAAPAGGGVPY